MKLDGSGSIPIDGTTTVFVDLSPYLRSGETITGTPTASKVNTDDAATVGTVSVLASTTTVPSNAPLFGGLDGSIAASEGFCFTVNPTQEYDRLPIVVQAVTTGVTPAQTLRFEIELNCL